MKRFTIVLSTLAALTQTSGAQDFGPIVDALFGHMTATYMCRDALGGLGHYQAARSIATSTATQLMGQNEGVLAIDAFEKKLMDDPRSKSSYTDTQACTDLASGGLQRIQVERAKLGLL